MEIRIQKDIIKPVIKKNMDIILEIKKIEIIIMIMKVEKNFITVKEIK